MAKAWKILTGLLLVISILVACGSGTEEPPFKSNNTPGNENKISGKKLYTQYCIACHGADGALGFSGAQNLQESQLEMAEVVEMVKKGKGAMTGFEKMMSPDEIEAVAEYTLKLRK